MSYNEMMQNMGELSPDDPLYIATIDEVVDAIIDILSYETWAQVGAFMEDANAAIHLPLCPDMWLVLTTKGTIAARILQGKNCKVIAGENGDTLEEAVCRTWLEWQRSL